VGPTGAGIAGGIEVVVLRAEIEVVTRYIVDPLSPHFGDLQRVVAIVSAAGEGPIETAVGSPVQAAVAAEQQRLVRAGEGEVAGVAVIGVQGGPGSTVIEVASPEEGSRGKPRHVAAVAEIEVNESPRYRAQKRATNGLDERNAATAAAASRCRGYF